MLRRVAPLAGALACMTAPAVVAAEAGDFARGLALYENHCTGCHESVVHVRETREVADAAGLEAEVRRRARWLGLAWGAQEVRDVVRYLSERYYGFGASDATM